MGLAHGIEAPPLYAQENEGKDAIIYAKFFTPDADWTWYLTEYDPATGEAFGLVKGTETELGYFSIPELITARGGWDLPVERDTGFPDGQVTIGDIRSGKVSKKASILDTEFEEDFDTQTWTYSEYIDGVNYDIVIDPATGWSIFSDGEFIIDGDEGGIDSDADTAMSYLDDMIEGETMEAYAIDQQLSDVPGAWTEDMDEASDDSFGTMEYHRRDSLAFAKCKDCGQELVTDEEEELGVCEDCLEAQYDTGMKVVSEFEGVNIGDQPESENYEEHATIKDNKVTNV